MTTETAECSICHQTFERSTEPKERLISCPAHSFGETVEMQETHFTCPEKLAELGGAAPCCECTGHACLPPRTDYEPQERLVGRAVPVLNPEETEFDLKPLTHPRP